MYRRGVSVGLIFTEELLHCHDSVLLSGVGFSELDVEKGGHDIYSVWLFDDSS